MNDVASVYEVSRSVYDFESLLSELLLDPEELLYSFSRFLFHLGFLDFLSLTHSLNFLWL